MINCQCVCVSVCVNECVFDRKIKMKFSCYTLLLIMVSVLGRFPTH